jgi:hypothetical protein
MSYGFRQMAEVLWYFGPLILGWVLVGAGIWFLSRQLQRYNPPIPALVWLIGIILSAQILSFIKVTFVPGSPSAHPFFASGDAWEQGWPYRWYGMRSLLVLAAPYFLLFNTILWTISLGGWSYLTIRFLPWPQNRHRARLWALGSIALALIVAYVLPFLFQMY